MGNLQRVSVELEPMPTGSPRPHVDHSATASQFSDEAKAARRLFMCKEVSCAYQVHVEARNWQLHAKLGLVSLY